MSNFARSLHRYVLLMFACATLVALAGCGASGSATSAATGPTPSPTLDAQTQGYLTALHTDYQLGLLHDERAEMNTCGVPVGWPSGTDTDAAKQTVMQQDCLPTFTDIKTHAQALFEHLSAMTAPARFQTPDAGFKQAAQATATYANQVLAAIKANNVSQFEALWPGFDTAFGMFCGPIAQIDPLIPLDYTLAAPPGGICGN